MKEKKVCKVCGGKVHAKGYCHKHYEQIRNYGEVYETLQDKNKILIYDTYAEIILCDKYKREIGRAKIDLEDVDKVKNYKWGIGCRNYIRGKINGKQILLHRFIMGVVNKEIDVDHINGDPNDNRKCNLRVCSHADNMKNQKKNSRNTSGYKGVSWNKKSKAWEVNITKNGKRYYLGIYKDKEEAIKVRKDAEEKYFGEFNRDEEYL